MDFVTKIDFYVLNSIIKYLKCSFLDAVMPLITALGDHGIFPISVAVILLIIAKTRRIGLSMAFSFIYGGVIGNLFLKNLIGRSRPYDASYAESIIEEGELLISGLSDFSFPSGHTLIIFEFAVVLLICLKGKYKPISIIAVITAFLVAFSRLYLYVHFPSDVFAGMILGTLFGILGVKTANALITLIINKLDKKKG